MNPVARQGIPRLARLRAFDGVAALGGMGAAADLLHVTQPAVTHAVQSLERELGVRLLTRGTGGSFLTGHGNVFARRTRRFFLQLNAALQEATGADAQSVARLARKISDVHIRCLPAIAAERSFRGAARALGIAEPTLHRPARELERLVRAPLFRRMPDGIGLSPKGAELARRFALSMTEIAAGIEELSSHQHAARTTAVLGVLPLAPKRLPAMAAEGIMRRHANARLAIREGGYDELVVLLRSGAIDAIFGALRAPPPFGDLAEERLFEDPYCVVCRRDHPLTRLSRPTIADLKGYDWVFASAGLPRRVVLDEIIAAWKLSTRVQVETNSLGALIGIVAGSDRISLMPRAYITLDGNADTLAAVDLDVPHKTRIVGLTTRQDWLPTSLQAEFLALLGRIAANRHRAGLTDE